MVSMKSSTVFHNPRIRTAKGDGIAQTGEEFETDLEHAKELRRNGLAYPVRPEDMDGEPLGAALPAASANAEATIPAPVAVTPAARRKV